MLELLKRLEVTIHLAVQMKVFISLACSSPSVLGCGEESSLHQHTFQKYSHLSIELLCVVTDLEASHIVTDEQ